MSAIIEPTTTPGETISDGDERRWDRGAWLTLAAGLALVLVPLLTSLAGMGYPGDGWASKASGASNFTFNGVYRLTENDSGLPSPLQREDLVLAINGRPLTDDSLPPVPAGVQVGDMMRYTVERGGNTFDVDVPVVQLTPAAFGRSMATDFRENTGNAVFSLLLFAMAIIVFFLRPGSLAARYLLLFAMYGQGISLSMYSGIFLATYPAWMAFLMADVWLGLGLCVHADDYDDRARLPGAKMADTALPAPDTVSAHGLALSGQHRRQRSHMVRRQLANL